MAHEEVPTLETFGAKIPYGDPTWYQGWSSHYFNDSHVKFRAAVREFVDKEIIPYCHDWEEQKKIPDGLREKAYQAGLLSSPWEYPQANLPGGISAEEYDLFHALIAVDEFSRCGSAGVIWGLLGGKNIGLPPVINFGSNFLKEKVVKDCATGKKVICLCITEPHAGSDVANLQTEAIKSKDGKHYVVNGQKKWITNGVFADFFTVAVRTGGPGMGGISLLLLERGMKGITTSQMACQGVWSSGTTFITFEDVEVPVENLIGAENKGFKYIMSNFNKERWGLIVMASRFARVCYEEAFKYAHKRETFGKRLIDHPVIRQKLAHMVRQIEATNAWLETVTHQMQVLGPKSSSPMLFGPLALLKVQATTTLEFCAREASQIFGGLSYTRGGQAEKVERLYRDLRSLAIGGGSEEVMLDLAVRQAMMFANL
eukprot:Phypoly_transcript_08717.p1 GENE.Phypoly_transcript_08717~~Phypoly_transcript_08717.p1  ORF type:complete len:436 (+),score=55.67 Phypoly_transcript_08717:27-1310(+)